MKRLRIREKYQKVKNSGKMKNFLVFLIFIFIAAFFWLFMVMNEVQQQNMDVRIELQNVPDSVTFITDIPSNIHITVKEKGFNLFRFNYINGGSLKINFNDFVEGEKFNISRTELITALKDLFGSEAVIISVNPEMISAPYTTGKGEKFPIVPRYSVECESGMTLAGIPKLSVDSAIVYGLDIPDTLKCIYTDPIILKGVDKPTTVESTLAKISGLKIMPKKIDVTFDIETLVKKTTDVLVKADYIPSGQDILFFPSRVKVSYYVPMNKYSETNDDVEVTASYREAEESSSDKVSVKVTKIPGYISNVEILTDSVEYTLVRGN